MKIVLSKELGGSPGEHGFVLRNLEGSGDGLIDVYSGDVDDLVGAQRWAGEILWDRAHVTVQRWTQDADGRAAEWPYWTAETPPEPVDVSTWSRLDEVFKYADKYDMPFWKAVEELVNSGLSHEPT